MDSVYNAWHAFMYDVHVLSILSLLPFFSSFLLFSSAAQLVGLNVLQLMTDGAAGMLLLCNGF